MATTPAVICAENVALLTLLHSAGSGRKGLTQAIPAQPTVNTVDRRLIRQEGYALSFDSELRLTTTLAFLSGISDNPNLIPALFVEEDEETVSLKVFLAVNRSQSRDGNQFLREVKTGLDTIFAILARVTAANNGSSDIENELFGSILSLCSSRILCRLRLVADARNSSKQPFKSVLQNAILFLSQSQKSGPAIFVEEARVVIRLLDEWKKHQTSVRLGNLIEGISRLRQADELEAVVKSIPDRVMQPSSRRSLINIIKKVARYREAGRVLYRLAKKFPLVRRMETVLVAPPPEAFSRISPGQQYEPDLDVKISGTNRARKRKTQRELQDIYHILGTTSGEAKELCYNLMRKTMQEGKIHAEVQLVLEYEKRVARLPPRAISSSKDACYLCNAFVKSHGKLHIPRCHGRLYPGWRMPETLESELQIQFNKALDAHIRHSLNTLCLRREITVYPNPNESTLDSIPCSASTLANSLLPAVGISQQPSLEAVTTVSYTSVKGTEIAASITQQSVQILQGLIPNSEVAVEKKRDAAQVTSELNILSPYSKSQNSSTQNTSSQLSGAPMSDSSFEDAPWELRPGEMQSVEVKAHDAPLFYRAGVFEIQVEYLQRTAAKSTNCNDDLEPRLRFSIEWLAAEEAARLMKYRASSIVDGNSLGFTDVEVALNDENCFYISAGNSCLKFTRQ